MSIQQMLLGTTPSGGAGSGYDATMLALLPWGYWKLDDTSLGNGASIADSSGNGRSGTVNASSSLTSVSGLYGSSVRAITFPAPGAAGIIVLPSYTMAASEIFSVVLFMKVPAVDANPRQMLSADDNGSNRRWQFRLLSGKIQFVTISPSVTTTESASALSNGSTHMVAFVFDPTLAAVDGVVKIYVDGVLDAQSTTAITLTAGTTFPGIASRSGAAASDYFGGVLDNVALFRSKALTATDIANLWAARAT